MASLAGKMQLKILRNTGNFSTRAWPEIPVSNLKESQQVIPNFMQVFQRQQISLSLGSFVNCAVEQPITWLALSTISTLPDLSGCQ